MTSHRLARLTFAAALAGLAAACTPDLQGRLACNTSAQCPTGYYCDLAQGKCLSGTTKPEVTLLTPGLGKGGKLAKSGIPASVVTK